MTRHAIRVAVHAADPISRSGIVDHLRAVDELALVAGPPPADADVVVAVTDTLAADDLALLRGWAAVRRTPVVLVADQVRPAELLAAVGSHVVAVLSRRSVCAESLAHAARAARGGGGVLPVGLQGALLRHVEGLQRAQAASADGRASGLTPREIEVLRLVAEGWDTDDIAQRIGCSQRTVKNVVHAMTSRLDLRNRTHAVAYALREGVI